MHRHICLQKQIYVLGEVLNVVWIFFIFIFKDYYPVLQLTVITCHSSNDLFASKETCSFRPVTRMHGA